MASTIRHVAEHAGVSRGTVSNVINRPEIVADETRERVRRSMRKLNFVPSAPARVLAGARSASIGLVVHSLDNPFFVEVARGVEEVASARDYVVSLMSTGAEPKREARSLSMLQAQRVSGVLLTPARGRPRLVTDLRRSGMAVVLLDQMGDSRECSVSVDDHLGGRLAGHHLLDRGHQRLVFVGGPRWARQHADRLRGFEQAVEEAGLSVTENLHVLHVTALSVEAGHQAAASLLRSREQLPSAVLCGNDLLAVGLLRAALQAGLRVPDDLSVMGYDDIELASLTMVPLTSVRQPMYDLGQRAADLVISEITDPDHEHRQVRFAPQLVERATVAKARPAPSRSARKARDKAAGASRVGPSRATADRMGASRADAGRAGAGPVAGAGRAGTSAVGGASRGTGAGRAGASAAGQSGGSSPERAERR